MSSNETSASSYDQLSSVLFTLLCSCRCCWGMGSTLIELSRAFWEKWGVYLIYPSYPWRECFSNHTQQGYKPAASAYYHPSLLSVTNLLFYLFSCHTTLPFNTQIYLLSAPIASTSFSASSTGTHLPFYWSASSPQHLLSSTASTLGHCAWPIAPSLYPEMWIPGCFWERWAILRRVAWGIYFDAMTGP